MLETEPNWPMSLAPIIAYGRAVPLCLLLLTKALSASAQSPPIIEVEPQDQYACVGSGATFFTQATGDQPIGFFWFRDGSPVSDGIVSTPTNSFLTVTNLQLADNGSQFYVVASNQFGSTPSTSASLFVADAPQITQQP